MKTVHCSACGRQHAVRPPSPTPFARRALPDDARGVSILHACDCGQGLRVVLTADDDHGLRFAVRVEVTTGDVYEAGEDYETDVLVLGREMADAAWAAKAMRRPPTVYAVTDAGSASKPWRVTRKGDS